MKTKFKLFNRNVRKTMAFWHPSRDNLSLLDINFRAGEVAMTKEGIEIITEKRTSPKGEVRWSFSDYVTIATRKRDARAPAPDRKRHNLISYQIPVSLKGGTRRWGKHREASSAPRSPGCVHCNT